MRTHRQRSFNLFKQHLLRRKKYQAGHQDPNRISFRQLREPRECYLEHHEDEQEASRGEAYQGHEVYDKVGTQGTKNGIPEEPYDDGTTDDARYATDGRPWWSTHAYADANAHADDARPSNGSVSRKPSSTLARS